MSEPSSSNTFSSRFLLHCFAALPIVITCIGLTWNAIHEKEEQFSFESFHFLLKAAGALAAAMLLLQFCRCFYDAISHHLSSEPQNQIGLRR